MDLRVTAPTRSATLFVTTLQSLLLQSSCNYSQINSSKYFLLLKFDILNPKSMFLHYVTEKEIKQKISLLEKKGIISDFSRRFLRLCVNYVSKYICFLFNFCIDEATFPDKFKIAKISPIYKKGPKNVIINYRPIAALCNINKLFESFFTCSIDQLFCIF